jgi:hypothetical protein
VLELLHREGQQIHKSEFGENYNSDDYSRLEQESCLDLDPAERLSDMSDVEEWMEWDDERFGAEYDKDDMVGAQQRQEMRERMRRGDDRIRKEAKMEAREFRKSEPEVYDLFWEDYSDAELAAKGWRSQDGGRYSEKSRSLVIFVW